jgi:hypothetical protein
MYCSIHTDNVPCIRAARGTIPSTTGTIHACLQHLLEESLKRDKFDKILKLTTDLDMNYLK